LAVDYNVGCGEVCVILPEERKGGNFGGYFATYLPVGQLRLGLATGGDSKKNFLGDGDALRK